MTRLTMDQILDAWGGPANLADHYARSGRAGKVEFLDILLRDIEAAIRELEANANEHQGSSENLMTRQIVTFLIGRYYAATSDENERGHADIKVLNTPLNLRWIAEAKKHKSYEHALDGMRQLLTRYTSGRDLNGGFFLYIFGEKATLVASRWKEEIEQDAPLAFRRFEDGDADPLRFVSVHEHEAVGQEFKVRQFLISMRFEPKDKSARASTAAKTKKRDAASVMLAAGSTDSADVAADAPADDD